MLSRLIAVLLLTVVIYVGAIFLAPTVADAIAGHVWLRDFNASLRLYKERFEMIETTSQLRASISGSTLVERIDSLFSRSTLSGSLALSGVTQNIDQIQVSLKEAQDEYKKLQALILEKRRQWKAVLEDVQKLAQTARDIQAQMAQLTSFSGMLSNSGTEPLSWKY